MLTTSDLHVDRWYDGMTDYLWRNPIICAISHSMPFRVMCVWFFLSILIKVSFIMSLFFDCHTWRNHRFPGKKPMVSAAFHITSSTLFLRTVIDHRKTALTESVILSQQISFIISLTISCLLKIMTE